MNQLITEVEVETKKLSVEEATKLDEEIVSLGLSLREKLFKMFTGEGYLALGFETFRAYLKAVSERSGFQSESTLYRATAAARLEAGAGLDFDTVPEAAVREIARILPTNSGEFEEGDRVSALKLAVQDSTGPKVTMEEAAHAARMIRMQESKDPLQHSIRGRWEEGRLPEKVAAELSDLLVKARKEDSTAVGIIPWVSDPRIVKFMLKLERESPSAYDDLLETATATGYFSLHNGEMVSIKDATLEQVMQYLNKKNNLAGAIEAATRAHAQNIVAKHGATLIKENATRDRIFHMNGSAAKFWAAVHVLANQEVSSEASEAWFSLNQESRDRVLKMASEGLGPSEIYSIMIQEDASRRTGEKREVNYAIASIAGLYAHYLLIVGER